jgi:Uma2 family endonuclease
MPLTDYAKKYSLTTEHFQQMIAANIFREHEQIELIEGELIEMVPINPPHSGKTGRLNQLFSQSVHNLALVYVQTPIWLDVHSQPQPDITIARIRDDFYETAHPQPQDILLLLEIADTSVTYDKNIKIPLYGRYGIPEVWLIDLQKQRVEIYTQASEAGYRQVRFPSNNEPVTLMQLPEVVIQLASIWAKPSR